MNSLYTIYENDGNGRNINTGLPPIPTIYKMGACWFPVSEGTENKPGPSLVGKEGQHNGTKNTR